ncbi:MAG: helix-turn-helix transcriptional regulator [Lachnospiraceae bacterium]|nr:helix-turn-helix transcriptional regulator [Lachnospiraceae bacterium]
MRLKELRKQNKMTQHMVAQKVGVSRSTVAMWETGQNEPDNQMLLELAMLFNCSVDYLLERTEDRIDDPMLDMVNELPNELLEKHGNALEAQREYEAQKKEAPSSGLDDRLVEMLVSLSPDQVQRVLDFVAGLKASEKV